MKVISTSSIIYTYLLVHPPLIFISPLFECSLLCIIVYGDWTRLWLRGMTIRTFHYLAPTIPESVYCTYQLTFAIITAALMLGAFADRMKVSKTQSNH